MAFPNVSYSESLHVTRALITLNKNHTEIKRFYLQNNKYPDSLDEINHIVKVDPWGRDLIYNQTEQDSYFLYSVGKNGIDDYGMNDDLVSYKKVDRSFYPEMGVTQSQAWLRIIATLLIVIIAIYLIIKLKRSNKFKNYRLRLGRGKPRPF